MWTVAKIYLGILKELALVLSSDWKEPFKLMKVFFMYRVSFMSNMCTVMYTFSLDLQAFRIQSFNVACVSHT